MILDKYGGRVLGKFGSILQKMHGNDHRNPAVQWVYVIVDLVKNELFKDGIASGKIVRKTGLPVRTQSQVNKLNKSQPGRFEGRVVDTVDHGQLGARGEARTIEKDLLVSER